jgi:hypothetical protein
MLKEVLSRFERTFEGVLPILKEDIGIGLGVFGYFRMRGNLWSYNG